MTDAYINVSIEPGAVTQTAEEIAEIDEVTDVHLVTGEFDVIVQIELDSPDDLPGVVADKIHSIPGIFDTVTHVAYEP